MFIILHQSRGITYKLLIMLGVQHIMAIAVAVNKKRHHLQNRKESNTYVHKCSRTLFILKSYSVFLWKNIKHPQNEDIQ